MNCSNADSETIASDVDLSRRNSNARSKSSRNNEKYVANINDSSNTDINVREREEQRLFVKRSSSEADATSLKRFERKKQRESERVHCKECTETENICTTA